MNAPGPGGVTDLEYLEYVASFAAWLEAHPYIQHVYSLPDILKRLNRNMHGDDPEYYVFPDSREKAAQYLLLYEMSLPYGLDLTNRVNFDKSSSRLTVQVGDVSSLPMREFYAETEQWLIEHTPEYMHTKPTGMFLMFNYLDLRSAISLSEGAIYAFIAIMLTLTLSFWSPWLGALSLLPNVLPLTTTFGIWALIHPQIDLGFIPIAPICLGIVVDNTVHFLSKYIRGKNEQGYDVKNAVRYSFNHVGQAISFNTLILVLGFSVLTLSNYKPNFHLGLLTAAAVSVAFIIDMLFFPALIIALDDFKQRFKSRW